MTSPQSNSVSNPGRIRIENRRAEQKKWRNGKPWKLFRDAHARVPGAFCAHCLKQHGTIRKNGKKVILTINHLSRRKYASLEEYLTWDDDCEVCCTVCNWMFEKGKKPCPVCHDIYIHWTDDMCQGCWDNLHPREKEERDLKKWKKDVLWRLKKVLLKDAQAVMRKRIRDDYKIKQKPQNQTLVRVRRQQE